MEKPQGPNDCRFKYGKGTAEMSECLEQFKKPTSLPSPTEFLVMGCEELSHLYPDFSNKESADAWNARMHECINQEESTLLQNKLEKWNKIECDKILDSSKSNFEDSTDKRAFDIRWKQCLE